MQLGIPTSSHASSILRRARDYSSARLHDSQPLAFFETLAAVELSAADLAGASCLGNVTLLVRRT